MIKTEKELRAKIATCTGNLKCKFEGTNGKRALIVCGGTGCLSSDSAAIIEEIERILLCVQYRGHADTHFVLIRLVFPLMFLLCLQREKGEDGKKRHQE